MSSVQAQLCRLAGAGWCQACPGPLVEVEQRGVPLASLHLHPDRSPPRAAFSPLGPQWWMVAFRRAPVLGSSLPPCSGLPRRLGTHQELNPFIQGCRGALCPGSPAVRAEERKGEMRECRVVQPTRAQATCACTPTCNIIESSGLPVAPRMPHTSLYKKEPQDTFCMHSHSLGEFWSQPGPVLRSLTLGLAPGPCGDMSGALSGLAFEAGLGLGSVQTQASPAR